MSQKIIPPTDISIQTIEVFSYFYLAYIKNAFFLHVQKHISSLNFITLGVTPKYQQQIFPQMYTTSHYSNSFLIRLTELH